MAWGNDCSRAVDGNEDSDYFKGSCYHGAQNEKDPWIRIDLGGPAKVDTITVTNRFV